MSSTSSSPIVFLPGWGLGREVLEKTAEAINAQVLDLPGYGNTPLIERFDDAVQAIGDGLALKTNLIGWSLGAMLAIAIAARMPHKVGRLVLVAGTASFVQRAECPDALPPSALADFKAAVLHDADKAIPRFVAGFNRGDLRGKAVTQTLLSSMGQMPPNGTLLTGLDWLRDVDLRPELSVIQAPTLLIHGSADPLMPLSTAESLRTLLPNTQTPHLITLPGCAHAPFVSQPELFCSHILRFFDAHPQ